MIIEFITPESSQKGSIEIDLTLEGLEKDILGTPAETDFSFDFDHSTAVNNLNCVKRISDKYFPYFVDILNQHLRTNLDLRVWKVLIGHWYFSFAKALFCRVMIVEKLAEDPNLLSLKVMRQSDGGLSALTSSDITDQCMDYSWNEQVFAEICLATTLIPKEKLNISNSSSCENPQNHDFAEDKGSFSKRLIQKVLSLYVPFQWQRSRPIFYYTGMSHWEHIKLFLMSGGMPVWLKKQSNFTADEDKSRRQILVDSFADIYVDSESPSSAFECALQSLFFKCLPRNFLEAFQQNFLLSGSKAYPQKPKYIFMANGFWIDSLSFFVAKQILSGVPYLVGQHGGHFGVSKIEMSFPVEEETADIFLTWGHSNSACRKTLPCFNWIKSLPATTISTEPKLVIITRPPWPSKEHFSIAPWYKRYIRDVVSLVHSLDEKLMDKVVLRIHPGGAPSLEKKIWAEFLPDVRIDDSNEFEIGTIGDGGFLVFTYLSTLLYEVLDSIPSLNIVGVWSDIKKDVKEEHINTFEKLHCANLLFDSFSDAGAFISKNYGNVETVASANTKRTEAISNFNLKLNRGCSSSSPSNQLLEIIDLSIKDCE